MIRFSAGQYKRMSRMMQLVRARHHLAMRVEFEQWVADFSPAEARRMFDKVEQAAREYEEGYRQGLAD